MKVVANAVLAFILAPTTGAEIECEIGPPLIAALAADDQCSSESSNDDVGDGCALGLIQIRAQHAQDAARPKTEHSHSRVSTKIEQVKPRTRRHALLRQETKLSKIEAEGKFIEENSYAAQMAKFSAFAYEHPRWLQNCTNIYFVLGANIGVGIRKAFETEKYADSPLLPVLDNIFGDGEKRRELWKDSGFCALGFEPNPRHAARHASISKAYLERGWHSHVYQYAAWHTESVMAFNTTGKRPRVLGDSASGDKTSPGAHLSLRYKGIPGSGDGLAVRTVDFANFLRSMLDHSAEGASVKLLTMDIEGAEYETLAQMMRMNVLCQDIIDNVLISAHKYGDTEHWRGGRNHTRSFREIEWRMQQLSLAKVCGSAGVSKVAAFEDNTYSQDLDEHFGSHYDRRTPDPEVMASYEYYSDVSGVAPPAGQSSDQRQQQHAPKPKAPKKAAQAPKPLDDLLHGK